MLNIFQILRFRIDDSTPYSIPSGSNGENLALLIKSILIEKRKSRDEFGNEIEDSSYKSVLDQVEFDFYINGEFLDSTLDRFLLANTQIKTVSSHFSSRILSLNMDDIFVFFQGNGNRDRVHRA